MNHPHGIYCLHVHEWHIYLWCNSCFIGWQTTSGKIADVAFQQQADRDLARQVVIDLIEDQLPCPRKSLN